MKKSIKKIILKIILFIHFKYINYHLKKIKKKKIVYYTTSIMGLGDTLQFYLLNIKEIEKRNVFILVLTTYQLTVANYLFDKEKIIKIPILISGSIAHYYQKFLENNLNLKSQSNPQPKTLYSLLNNNFLYNKLVNKIKKEEISKKLLFLEKKKYFSLYIKHYNSNKNDIHNSFSRQTSDIDKIKSLIKYLNKKKIVTLIFGTKKEKSILELKKKYLLSKNKMNYFFCELSEKYSFNDQVFAAKNSIGLSGNGSFIPVLFYFLKKKMVIFDHHYDKYVSVEKQKKYKKFLYKRFKNKKKFSLLTTDIINKNYNNNLTTKEVSIRNIIHNIDRFILKK